MKGIMAENSNKGITITLKEAIVRKVHIIETLPIQLKYVTISFLALSSYLRI